MGVIPGHLLRHTITIEPYQGEGGSGPVYGPGVEVRCFREDSRKLVRNQLGEQVVSESQAYCLPGTVAPPKSRVTIPGSNPRTAFVIQAKDRDGGGLPTPDHVELVLT